MGGDMNALVSNGPVRPHWLSGDRFWYRNQTARGAEYILVDPQGKKKAPAFDHEAVARALSAAAGTQVGAYALDVTALTDQGPELGWAAALSCAIRRAPRARQRRRQQGPTETTCSRPTGGRRSSSGTTTSGSRDVATGRETQLTTDGVKDYGYATDNAGWTKSDRPVVLWSPDSKKIATFQMDERGVGDMYLVSTAVGHPRLEAWKYPCPRTR